MKNTRITLANFRRMTTLFNAEAGALVMAGPGPRSHGNHLRDGKVNLYHRPELHPPREPSGPAMSSPHYDEMLRTDRDYWLRPIHGNEDPLWSYLGFPLSTSKYRFVVSHVHCSGQGLISTPNDIAIFVPKNGGDREQALYEALEHCARLVLKSNVEKNVDTMMQYLLADFACDGIFMDDHTAFYAGLD